MNNSKRNTSNKSFDAVKEGNIDEVKHLINTGAKVDAKNESAETTYIKQIASQRNTLHFKHLDDDPAKEVNDKLKKFVESFVYIYERFLSEYYERLQNQKVKQGKCASIINGVIDLGKGGTELIPTAEVKASSTMEISILQKVISSIGNKHNRKELKKLIDQLYIFIGDLGGFREELVKSSIEIFQSFESQFVQVTADGSWERAMEKLAHDAVNRIINYSRSNTEEGFSTSSIIKGVVFGKSKKYKHTSTGIPHIKPGHTLKDKNSNSWNTAELFDEAGLVTIKNDGNADKYYKRKGKKNDKYGYRLLFQWELEDQVGLAKKLNIEYQEEKPTREGYKYILKPDEKLKNVLLSEINSQDPKLVEERLIENFQEGIEQVKQDAEESFNELESYIDKNFGELSNYIENNKNEIKRILSEVARSHLLEEASQQLQKIACSIEEVREETKEGLKQIGQKLDEMRSVIIGGQLGSVK